MSSCLRITCLAVIVSLSLARAVVSQSTAEEPVDYVDPLIGTSDSRWMLFPGPAMPQGMVKLSPDNEEQGWKAGYEYDVDNIAGFSHIHSWVMGGILTMPTTGPLQILPGSEANPDAGYRSRFRHNTEVAEVGYYAVTLDDYGIRAELTATIRTGIQRYTFPAANEARILVDLETPTEYGYILRDAVVRRVTDSEIEGFAMQFTHDEFTGFDNDYTVHFVMRFSRPFTSMGGWVNGEITEDADRIAGHGDVGVFLNYRPDEGDQVIVQTGISLVSVDQARLNLETETAPFGWDFDAARRLNRSAWNEILGKIELEGGSERNRRKFYTNMYRAFAARTTWSDVNGKWVDACEQVRQLADPEFPMLGADAFWNSFWNLNLLWTLVAPDVAEQWVRSFLEMYDAGGWLPKGPTGLEYSSIMVASHEIPLIVAAYQKGIRGFDAENAYAAILHNQSVQGRWHECGGFVGNRNLASYMKYGFVAHGDSMGWKIWGTPWEGSASNTLEYAYDDWTVAQMAKSLGRDSDHREFLRRAGYYRNQWDEATAYMRPRYADGSWAWFAPIGRKDQVQDWYGTGYVEGNAWLFSWFVPHDVAGLIELYGGREPFTRRLLAGFEASKEHDFGTVDGLFVRGYVNHGNQPNMQAAYLFNYAGMPWETQRWARAIMDQFYGEGPEDGWPGDEDQGQMGAWFVNSALGLFEMQGGAAADPVLDIGSPLFERATIHLDGRYYEGDTFVIEARGASEGNRFIQAAWLDGERLSRPWIYFRDVVDGGRLVLEMGAEPNREWGSLPEDAPPSMSAGQD